MNILLVSSYELGRQPFGLAHPAKLLRQHGFEVKTLDISVEKWDPSHCRHADLIGFYLPMHTATRLSVNLIKEAKRWNSDAHMAAFGLYAPLNKDYLRELGIDTVLAGEFESELLLVAQRLTNRSDVSMPIATADRSSQQKFVIPDRSGLPALDRYAHLMLSDGRQRTVGFTETTRGCKHLCRHCPVVPVYQGRFKVIPREIALADIRQQVAAGAEHISFGDADFFNGPTHGLNIAKAMHHEFPNLTYDVTIKVEHLLNNQQLLPLLKQTGCLFITTAVESLDDGVLMRLEKGHTKADFYRLVSIVDDAGLDIAPTFIPFTPWTTLTGYLDLLRSIAALGLINAVAPVQLAIRLLIPPGSWLLKSAEVLSVIDELDQDMLCYPWRNPDGRLDELQSEIQGFVQNNTDLSWDEVFSAIWELACKKAGVNRRKPVMHSQRLAPARHSEPWYCCAEPTARQYASGINSE